MTRWLGAPPFGYEAVVQGCLAEDLSLGDPSSLLLEGSEFSWIIEAQQDGVVSGSQIAAELLNASESPFIKDGDSVTAGTIILKGSGPAPHVMAMERNALNFLTFMSGTATLTREYVKAIEGTNARIIDTRKTMPGLRSLQKYAVRCGGGHNHRYCLGDGILLKDNHVAAMGSITNAVAQARVLATHLLKIEVECDTVAQVEEAIAAGADVVLLDNMTVDQMNFVVGRHRGSVLFEASGGVNLERVREIAETGVNVISIGALTHSAPGLRLHLEPA